MSKRILLRHGQSMFNAGETDDYDSNITERGYYQIQEASLHVQQVLKWSEEEVVKWVGFVSPYLRCLKTAFRIHKRLGINMIVDARVGEVPDDLQRALRGGPLPNRSVNFPGYDWGRFPKSGLDISKRTMDDYRNDLTAFVKELPDNAIIVSHMTTIRDLTEMLTGLNLKDKEVLNCSVTFVEDDELVFIGKK